MIALLNARLADADMTSRQDYLKALARCVAAFGKLAREAVDHADEAGDKGAADLFTALSKQMDMDLWFLEAHPLNPA